MDAFTTAALVHTFSSPWVLVACLVACMLAGAGAALAHFTSQGMEHEAGDTHTDMPHLGDMRTADAGLIELQARELRRTAWEQMSTTKHAPQHHAPGRAPECQPPCSPRACDMDPNHCARATEGGNVRVMQRLSRAEVAAIKQAAQEAAWQDHEDGTAARPTPDRANPLPRHTRAYALWGTEYAATRITLAHADGIDGPHTYGTQHPPYPMPAPTAAPAITTTSTHHPV